MTFVVLVLFFLILIQLDFCILLILGQSERQFQAIKIANVPFPRSYFFAASYTAASFNKKFEDFTVCYRFLVGSFNGWHYFRILGATGNKQVLDMTDLICCYDISFGGPAPGMGWGTEGYEGGYAGLGNTSDVRQVPTIHHFNGAMNIDIGTWQHICNAYSYSLDMFHMYQNGLKVFSFNYTGDVKYNLDGMFENLIFGQNIRGLITDVNIFSDFFDEEKIKDWTRKCDQQKGDIFSWEPSKLTTTEGFEITVEAIETSEVCMNVRKPVESQPPSKSSKSAVKQKFKPEFTINKPLDTNILEVITDFGKTNEEKIGSCLRLNGQMMSLPQTEEESELFIKTVRSFMMKSAGNNISSLSEHGNDSIVALAAGVRPRTWDLPNYDRSHTYPKKGMDVINTATGASINWTNLAKQNVWPQFASYYKYPKICSVSVYKWNERSDVLMGFCDMIRQDPYICIFKSEPTFRVRGLCKNAVMDTQYKLAEHRPANIAYYAPNKEKSFREYVGPKGWIISKNNEDFKWKMTHYHYTDLSLTMLDQDSLPVGRHKWQVENDVCNEGLTSTQTLLISACEEGQYTCHDGKCLDISKRCNNIEVTQSCLQNNTGF